MKALPGASPPSPGGKGALDAACSPSPGGQKGAQHSAHGFSSLGCPTVSYVPSPKILRRGLAL